jgi:hypothetical protein
MGVLVGAAVMVLTQVAMVAIMAMTPVHMRATSMLWLQFGLVIGIHVGAMYLPSLLTGVLVDEIGRVPMAIASGVTLLLVGVTAASAPGDSLGLLIPGLALLGVGLRCHCRNRACRRWHAARHTRPHPGQHRRSRSLGGRQWWSRIGHDHGCDE